MRYENVCFNEKWIKSLTKAQFVNHVGNQHHWPKLSTLDRKARLAEVHKLANLKNK